MHAVELLQRIYYEMLKAVIPKSEECLICDHCNKGGRPTISPLKWAMQLLQAADVQASLTFIACYCIPIQGFGHRCKCRAKTRLLIPVDSYLNLPSQLVRGHMVNMVVKMTT